MSYSGDDIADAVMFLREGGNEINSENIAKTLYYLTGKLPPGAADPSQLGGGEVANPAPANPPIPQARPDRPQAPTAIDQISPAPISNAAMSGGNVQQAPTSIPDTMPIPAPTQLNDKAVISSDGQAAYGTLGQNFNQPQEEESSMLQRLLGGGVAAAGGGGIVAMLANLLSRGRTPQMNAGQAQQAMSRAGLGNPGPMQGPPGPVMGSPSGGGRFVPNPNFPRR